MSPSNVRVDDSYREYAALLLRHHELLAEGKEAEAEAEEVEGRMTDLWEALDDDQRRSLRGVGSDLSWVRRGGVLPPRGPKAEDVTRTDRLRLSEAEEGKDWHAVLHQLRVCAATLSPGAIAWSRASAYGGIGLPALERVFRDLAQELSPGPEGYSSTSSTPSSSSSPPAP